MLAGHTHGGQVVLPVIGPVYSPSLFGVSHAAGLFTGGPVALHVSRGLGGKDPLRWHCTPELTRLCVSVQDT
jgi:predicted MPP superfamily phosphohydrolase